MNKSFFSLNHKLILALVVLVNFSKAQFTPGNLVVLQIGDGASTLANTGNQLIFREFNTGGAATFSVAIPVTGSTAMVLRGNATSEGYISRSEDGNNIVFGGYLQALPNTSVLNTSASSSIARGVGVVTGSGAYSIGASSNSFFTASDIRGAAATNSNNLWASGSGQGSNYFGSAATATTVQTTKTNLRATHIFNGQLYVSSQVATGTPTDIGVYAVGAGTPNTGPQTVTTVINCGTSAQPGQFFFNTAGTICYVADARTTSAGGVQKWVFSSGTWSLAYTLPTGTASAGAFGVVANFSGANPIVYATTTESSANRLIAIVDAGASSTATTLATASTSNTIFRGLAFAPGASTCVPVSVITTSNNAPVCYEQNLLLNVNAAGSAPITYSWNGQGTFNTASISNPTVTNSATGGYTVNLSNACGTASTVINVNINPTPTLLVNAASICAGGVATITASGASTYTWNNNSNNPTFTASPVSNTTYTLNGTSAAGCAANTVTTSITIVLSPTISANSATICVGRNATLTASGASTYTWSTTSNSTSIVVSPTSTSVYTVQANAAGCTATLSTTATVVVNALPVVNFSFSPSLICINSASVATLVPSPTGGVFSGSLVTGSTISTSVVGTYSVTYSYTNPATSCSNSIVKTVTATNCTGILGQELPDLALRVYPNPAGSLLNVVSDSNTEQIVQILDVFGREVIQLTFNKEVSVDVSRLSSGMYFVTCGGKKAIRFIKE